MGASFTDVGLPLVDIPCGENIKDNRRGGGVWLPVASFVLYNLCHKRL
jgi:hypothetical protein